MVKFSLDILNNKENLFNSKTKLVGQFLNAADEQPVVNVLMTQKETAKEIVKSASTGNIPLVKNTKTDEKMGLSVEKTTLTNTVKTTAANSTKTTETMDEFFNRYYSKYAKADEAGKQKFIAQYLKRTAAANAQEQDFKKLLQSGASKKDVERLASVIDQLNKDVQVKAATAVSKEQTEELNEAGRRIIAKYIQNYDKKAQKDVTVMLISTKDMVAIKEASSYVAKCDAANQTDLVKLYQEIENVDINKILIDQYAQYAKENQVNIHKVMSSSQNSETVEYAASNIYQFDKMNQAAAVQTTMNTNNEAAINAAAAKSNYYDKSVQAEIKSKLESTGYQSVKETLANAPQQDKTEVKKASAAATTEKVTETEEFKKAPVTEKVKMIEAMNGLQKENCMKDFIKKASSAEKLALISTLSPANLFSVLNLILDSNPSIEVLSKITDLVGKVKDRDKMTLLKKMNKGYCI